MTTQTASDATTRNVTIARAAYDAYVTQDREALEALLARDFHFTSPLDNRLDRETYFRRCWPHSKVIDGFDFINLVTHADRVFVTYEGRNTNGHRFRNTEILTIRDQHIIDVEVYFGWSVPHQAAQGGFVDESESQTQQHRQEERDARRCPRRDTTVAALGARGVVFEEYDAPGLETIDGVPDITGNYPSKGVGERAAWFRDSEGNVLGLGQPVRRSRS